MFREIEREIEPVINFYREKLSSRRRFAKKRKNVDSRNRACDYNRGELSATRADCGNASQLYLGDAHC